MLHCAHLQSVYMCLMKQTWANASLEQQLNGECHLYMTLSKYVQYVLNQMAEHYRGMDNALHGIHILGISITLVLFFKSVSFTQICVKHMSIL
jgi:hypothetical protein